MFPHPRGRDETQPRRLAALINRLAGGFPSSRRSRIRP